jgi:hypothetical protein
MKQTYPKPSTMALLISMATTLSACGKPPAPGATGDRPVATQATDAAITHSDTTHSAIADSGLAARDGELVNPDNATMVFLYYDLSGMPAPIDTWTEKDGRVQFAPGVDKAAQRSAVRAELQAGANAVRGIGVIHLSMGANLSNYDPAYEEFTVGALSPDSVVTFEALGQKVSLKFGNALAAQTWHVPKADAQPLVDKIGHRDVNLEVVLKVHAVQPGPGGGTIVVDALSYELHETIGGTIIGRVRVQGQP